VSRTPSAMQEALDGMRARVDAKLDELLTSPEPREARLVEGMRYSVLSGGKRIRPVLCLAAFEAAGGKGDAALSAAAALELIHAYSLVHDDLPCMDDDDVRRDQPTTHRAFGEGMAVLVGDALLTLAFDVLARDEAEAGIPLQRRLDVLRKVSHAAGVHGIIGGQVADLDAVAHPADASMIEYIHAHKTGALISAAVWTGARLGTDDPEWLARFGGYGDKIGFAFQVVDDLLDYEERPGEPASYVGCHGAEAARERAAGLVREAKEDLAGLGPRAWLLNDIADFIAVRNT